MFADYTKLVLRDYEDKRARNALSSRLSLPTTAKLREACMEVLYTGKCSRKDVRTLSDIFGGDNDQKAVLQKLENYKADKLKPLLNFIIGKTKSPDTRVVELLACLIDFEPRPFELGKHYTLPEATAEEPGKVEGRNEEEENEAGLSENGGPEPGLPEAPGPVASGTEMAGGEKKEAVSQEPDGTGTAPADPVWIEKAAVREQAEPDEERPVGTAKPETVIRKPGAVFKMRVGILAVAFLALAGVLVYRLEKNKAQTVPMSRSLPGTEACMYWAGDHYRQVSCTQKFGDTLVVALDPEKLRSFKKITRPDTITGQSKGAIWYVKINGGIEFYTSEGFHPVDQRLRLKPVTDYIIRKYIHPDQ
ncbi:hypothetical protein [Niabella drilacis]|uniref:Uncharacterized protein n=1 Tax=Niabella drilacis (strain DSM 25811 / CCM 8410 / CCUG 62505 / LMG 26954 / E90) TaxID=1285928 RepID=A0A1G6MU02_NIADE|nr:hypothetical protein [Niabella drilacis]SDC59030.1 hypothetical protein SAMN04487894_10339 [Niabella drilacis]